MKKSVLFSLICAVLVFIVAGCCSAKSDYSIVLLGDIHYDKAEFHQMPEFDKTVSWNMCRENGIFTWRGHNKWMNASHATTSHNYPLNVRMWKEDLPFIIDRAAKCGVENDSVYTFQLGDMIHGDCGKLDLHKKNLHEAIDYMTSRFKSPVLVSCGNHDPRGPFGQQAWNEVMLPYFDKAAKNIQRKNTNFSVRVGRDLYYFHDAINPDFDYLKKILDANKDARYTFFISHVPLFAMAKNHINDSLAENFDNLLSMLAECNAIVLSGHTHWISLTRYRHDGKRIDQFVLNSTMRKPARDSVFDPSKNISQDKFSPDYGGRIALWNKYADKITTPLNTWGTGHALLRVSDQGVFVDFYAIKAEKPYTYQLR